MSVFNLNKLFITILNNETVKVLKLLNLGALVVLKLYDL